LDEAKLIAHSIGALDVKAHCKASGTASALDVISFHQEQVLFRPCHEPMAERCDHAQMLFGTLFPEPNVHSDCIKASRLMPRKLGQEGWIVRSQWQTGMVVPNGHSIYQLACGV
jgi:hypothetical protein